MKKHKFLNRQPLLILVICFILGIFFQDHFSLDENYIYLIVVCCLIISISTFFRNYFIYKFTPYLLGIMFFGIGICLHFFNSSQQHIQVSGNKTIFFTISKKLNSNKKNRKYEAVVQTGNEKFNAVLYIPKSENELDFNHYYKTQAYISKPKAPQYAFQFNYAKYLARKDIDYQCYSNDKIFFAE
ncbi:DUF4131 domain-containing protein, partial [Flavobacterium sp. B17]|uniref:DUF4131 domain-containing protein n=1 Tax=Flavobacterium sp. B17 TaxID=95618 RepID=UPI001FCB13AE